MYMRYVEPWLDRTGWGKSWPLLEDKEPEAYQDPDTNPEPRTDPERQVNQESYMAQETPAEEINNCGARDTDRDQNVDSSEDDDDDAGIGDVEDGVGWDPEQPEEDNYNEEEAEYENEENVVGDEEERIDEADEGDPDISDIEEEDHYL